MSSSSAARSAYNQWAPDYDAFISGIDYEAWLGEIIVPALKRAGLRKGRLLDVGCGTGETFLPMLKRGWEVVGCDLSEGMLEIARGKVGEQVRLEVADMRQLPKFGEFELVWALNDPVNYLTEEGDLERAFLAMATNLAVDGLVLFDVNTFFHMENLFAVGKGMQRERGRWDGLETHFEPGGIFEARVFGRDAEPSIHRQRHWQDPEVREALQSAGLELVVAYGQRDDAKGVALVDPSDSETYSKTIYIAGLPQ